MYMRFPDSESFRTYSLNLKVNLYLLADIETFIFQMVGATRGTPGGFGDDGNGSHQLLPPPYLPPGLAEVLAAQTELLRRLVQGQQQQQQQHGHNVHQS